MRPVATYSGWFIHPSICQRVANRQINHGATVIFDIAGGCGFGAIAAAGLRGVKAVGIDTDLSSLGPQVIGSVVKRFDSAVDLAIQLEASHELHADRDYTLNLGNQGVDLVSLSPLVPKSVRIKLDHVITQMTARDCRHQHC
jgi:basic membrane protein A